MLKALIQQSRVIRFLPLTEAYPYKDKNFILNILHKSLPTTYYKIRLDNLKNPNIIKPASNHLELLLIFLRPTICQVTSSWGYKLRRI